MVLLSNSIPLKITFINSFLYLTVYKCYILLHSIVTVSVKMNPPPLLPEGFFSDFFLPMEFGLFPFRSPLLREYLLVSFLPVTEMFQFTGLPLTCLCIQHVVSWYESGWVSPFGNPRIKALVASYPRLIADCHVLHRLFVPRHSPYTLSNLFEYFTCYVCSSWTMLETSPNRDSGKILTTLKKQNKKNLHELIKFMR
jgi:hypothetical protein